MNETQSRTSHLSDCLGF